MSKSKFTKVYQFKVALKGIKPLILRRILVPENYSFWDLHVAIQDAMGWDDYHLHEFRLKQPNTKQEFYIGLPDDSGLGRKILPDWKNFIADWFTIDNKAAEYTYDFGDTWEHSVTLEKILPAESKSKYPKCIAGKQACPPEDCGGIDGYYEVVEATNNPKHERHEELLEWLGGEPFDPEAFDPSWVKFDNPDKRLKYALSRKI